MVKPFDKRKLIAMLINVIGLQVMSIKSSGLIYRMFCIMKPKLLLNTPINLYWNKGWKFSMFMVMFEYEQNK